MHHRPRPTFDLGILIDLPGPKEGPLPWPEQTYAHLCTDRQAWDPTVCLLPAGQIDIATSSADSWWYDGRDSRWKRDRITLPSVIYNRIGRRRIEASRAGKRLISHLSKRGHLFNFGFLDKASVFKVLDVHGVSHLMPPYLVNPDPQEALSFFRYHHDIYLKPANGSLGRGIGRLQRIGKNQNLLRLNPIMNASYQENILTDRQLPSLFSRFQKSPSLSSPYIIQATVALITWDDSAVDLRALMQMDPSGTWRLTGVAGRAAPRNGITTHTVCGGRRVSLDTLIREATTAVPTISAIETVCRTAAETLTRKFNPLVELSFDLGMVRPDQPGPLILEVNSKPFPFDEIPVREHARQRLMDYVTSLTKRRDQSPGSMGRVVHDE